MDAGPAQAIFQHLHDTYPYAVKNKHYKVLLYVNHSRCEALSDMEIAQGSQDLSTGPLLVQRFCSGVAPSPAKKKMVAEVLQKWRQQLMDDSFFMLCY